MPLSAADRALLREACAQAAKCAPVSTAYSVGAVLVGAGGAGVLATGFSREVPGNTHAEEVALLKLREAGRNAAAAGATLYCSMEPCSRRLSGKRPCAALLVEAGVARVVVAISEPPTFVADCSGLADLRAAGVQVR
jgi:pyrimidine deaminase RibD-like protein